MDLRIILASFILVFLAELGDKTQLTALAFTTSSRSPWAVFIGTSVALLAASGLAVAFGEALSRFLPVKLLHISSGVLFILMGLILLVNIARKAEFTDPDQTAAPAGRPYPATLERDHGPMFRLIINQAAKFEENLIDYLQELADQLPEGQAKITLRQIIKSDRDHSQAISGLHRPLETTPRSGAEMAAVEDLEHVTDKAAEAQAPVFSDFLIDHTRPLDTDNPSIKTIIEAAIEAEENIAEFYLAMARITKLHSARDAFRALAMEDLDHAQTLCSLINP